MTTAARSRKLGEFSAFPDYLRCQSQVKASSGIEFRDALGRICFTMDDFLRARADSAFPVAWYALETRA